MARTFSRIDNFIMMVDKSLRGMSRPIAMRENPAALLDETLLSSGDKQHIACYMRVNHAGEVSAQALYLGQALTAKNPEIRQKMQIAADEEIDHLAWCEMRLKELGSHTSYFTPLWFTGSLFIGIIAGLIGDDWNLGFLAETEAQVVKHLENHLLKIPVTDQKTLAILAQMHQDEQKHKDMAIASGAKELPHVVKFMMRLVAKVMTTTAYVL